MKDASVLLFSYLYDNRPLFKNQLDLVNQLLSDIGNPYYMDKTNVEEYNKEQTRLKTYISQLLSDNTVRSIPEDLKTSLIHLLSDRFKGETERIVVEIITALKAKNSKPSKSELKSTAIDQINADLNEANYIAVITSKPLEIDIQNDGSNFSLRNFLFKDLIERLSNKEKDLKYYRFNFPLDSYGDLFWRGLRRILINHLKTHITTNLIEALYSKFTLNVSTLSKLENMNNFSEDEIKGLVDEILLLLNRNRYILVFNTSAPIYGMPLIILNPSESKNLKIYSLLESEKDNVDVKPYKFSETDSLLWRVFVWDKLKSKNFAGINIPYIS